MEVQEAAEAALVAARAAEDSVEAASAAVPAEVVSEEARVRVDLVVRITVPLIITVPISVGAGTARAITAEAADVSAR